MAAIKRFEDILAWQKARLMVTQVYRMCSVGATSKDFALRDQLRRASVSVMSNIAEGYGRRGNREFVRFLNIATGSALETQSLLYVAVDVGYISESDFQQMHALVNEAIGLIISFSKYLQSNSTN